MIREFRSLWLHSPSNCFEVKVLGRRAMFAYDPLSIPSSMQLVDPSVHRHAQHCRLLHCLISVRRNNAHSHNTPCGILDVECYHI